MYIASVLLIISFGFTMLKFISCYSDGILLENQCNVINVDHGASPQTTEAPFEVDWTPEWDGTSTVTLSAKSGQFRGFMLDFRECDGSFSLVPQDSSRLLCGGRVMTQSNNHQKTSVRGLWTNKAPRECLFRVAFVETYSRFWEKEITVLPTTPPPTGLPTAPLTPEASSTQTNPTTRGLPTAPLTPEASSTQTNPTTRGLPTAPLTPEASSTQTNPTTRGLPTAPLTPEASSTQTNPTTKGLPTAPLTPEASSTQTNPTTRGLPTAPLTPEASSTQTNPTTRGLPTAPLTPEASSTQTNPTTKGLPTAPLTPEASSTQTNPTTRVTPSSPPQCVEYMRCIIALLLFSRLCFLGGSSLLIIIRPDLKKMVTMSASVLELASKTIAVILIVIKAMKYQCMYECPGLRIVFTALTVTTMVSSLLRTIIIFLHCGPSHELRKCWLYSIIMVDLMNTIVTTTAIFFGTWCFEEHWLPTLLGVYVVLEIMLYLGSVFFEKMEKYQIRKKVGNQNHIQEKRISPWLFMFLIFTIFNVMLTAALMAGVSLVGMIN